MNVIFNKINSGKTISPTQNQRMKNKFYSQAFDTISFGAKKSEFQGFDLACVQKYKAPIEKFKTNEDLQKWAKIKLDSSLKRDFKGRKLLVGFKRKMMLNKWKDYLVGGEKAYSSTMALLIFDGIIKNLKSDNDTIPPIINKDVLANTIMEISSALKSDKTISFNFANIYQTNLRNFFTSEKTSFENTSKPYWVKISSKFNDSKNFDSNISKLKALSHNSWCTKNFKAQPYLSQGDFHVLLKNSEPQVGIRLVGNTVEEIQGQRNNGKLPTDLLDCIENYIDAQKFSTKKIKHMLIEARDRKITCDLHKGIIEGKNQKEVLEHFGMNLKEVDGKLVLDNFRQLDDITYEELGLKIDKMLERVVKIEGDANFENSQVSKLPFLESIGGNALFNGSKIRELPKLREVGVNADFDKTEIKELPSLKVVGNFLRFSKSKLESLPSLRSVGYKVICDGCVLTPFLKQKIKMYLN